MFDKWGLRYLKLAWLHIHKIVAAHPSVRPTTILAAAEYSKPRANIHHMLSDIYMTELLNFQLFSQGQWLDALTHNCMDVHISVTTHPTNCFLCWNYSMSLHVHCWYQDGVQDSFTLCVVHFTRLSPSRPHCLASGRNMAFHPLMLLFSVSCLSSSTLLLCGLSPSSFFFPL